MHELVAIGNPVLDIIETPYVKTKERVLSGCSTNAALAFSKLGGKSALIGKANREDKRKIVETLRKYGVKAHILPSRETGGFHLRYLDRRMNSRELSILGIADTINIDEIERDFLKANGYVIAPILREINAEFVKKLREEVGKNALIFVDPQGMIRTVKNGRVVRQPLEDAYLAVRYVDVFKPNEHEAETLFPRVPPQIVARKITEMGCPVGIVTVAERGSYISYNGKTYFIPSYRTREKDPTGCGDVYIGAFAYEYLKTEDPLVSAAYASAVASFMVESVGPGFKIGKREVEERFQVVYEGVRRVL